MFRPTRLNTSSLSYSHGSYLDVVKYLVIEQQIDALCEDVYGNTPLHSACAGGCQAVVEFLTSELEKYNPITELVTDLRDKWSITPLHIVSRNGHLDILKSFISDKNFEPNISDKYGRTLHIASGYGRLHTVKYLTSEQGCNPSCLDEKKYTPLHHAAMKAHMNIVKFLTVEKHCDAMCRDDKGNTPLHMAAHEGHIKIVKFLILETHCDPTSKNTNNDTTLHLAVVEWHLDILQLLISGEKNCDPNSPHGQYGRTPFHCAAEHGHLHIVST